MEPSLKDTQYGFNDNLSAPEEIYRNMVISQTQFMTV